MPIGNPSIFSTTYILCEVVRSRRPSVPHNCEIAFHLLVRLPHWPYVRVEVTPVNVY
ncbi:hypothetical protein PILCRDRAFT_814486 [Piloderma croceum F 1598]|uniref:Uncharacterized protein n=1 Tax=Piloderma croceum (strain F 1598) TaxID=765440 RepID=A0A0C3FTT6_PILCF|nr:hypothetical protein PILCRDRAFT_814486 [Piloderma croceum F 1598]